MARESNETRPQFCNGADRQFAPAMRCANEDDSFDPRISVEMEPAMEKAAGGNVLKILFAGSPTFAPNSRA